MQQSSSSRSSDCEVITCKYLICALFAYFICVINQYVDALKEPEEEMMMEEMMMEEKMMEEKKDEMMMEEAPAEMME